MFTKRKSVVHICPECGMVVAYGVAAEGCVAARCVDPGCEYDEDMPVVRGYVIYEKTPYRGNDKGQANPFDR